MPEIYSDVNEPRDSFPDVTSGPFTASGRIRSTNDKHLSAASQVSMNTLLTFPNITKDGFLNRRTEDYYLRHGVISSKNRNPALPSSLAGSQWKPYRCILRGAKLYFYQLPTASYSSIIPITPSSAAGNDLGLHLIPSMFDASTRLLLFTASGRGSGLVQKYVYGDAFIELDGTSSSADMKRSSAKNQLCLLIFRDEIVVVVRKWVRMTRSIPPGASHSESEPISDPPEEQTVATLDVPSSSLVASKSLGNLASLQAQHLNKNVTGSEPSLQLSDDDDLSEATGSKQKITLKDKIINVISPSGSSSKVEPKDKGLVSATSVKMVTKLTFEGRFPIEDVMLLGCSTVYPTSISGAGHVSESPTFLFELGFKEQDKFTQRVFRARNAVARDRWIKEFETHLTDQRRRELEKPVDSRSPNFRTADIDAEEEEPEEEERVTKEMIERLWGNEFRPAGLAHGSSSQLNVQGQENSNPRQRKYWDTRRHPELVVKNESGRDVLVAGSVDGLTHEFLFRNLLPGDDDFGKDNSQVSRLSKFLVLVDTSLSDSESVFFECARYLRLALDIDDASADSLEVTRLSDQRNILLARRIAYLLNLAKSCGKLTPGSPGGIFSTLKSLLSKFDDEYVRSTLSDITRPVSSTPITVAIAETSDEILNFGPSGFNVATFLKLQPELVAQQLFLAHITLFQRLFGADFATLNIIRGGQYYADILLGESTSHTTASFSWVDFYLLLPCISSLEDSRAFSPVSMMHPIVSLIYAQILVTSRSSAPVKRALLLTRWIEVGRRLLNYRDFYGWYCIASSILSRPICRLSDTWEYVSKELRSYVTETWLPLLADFEKHSSNVSGQRCSLLFFGSVIQSAVRPLSEAELSNECRDARARGMALLSRDVPLAAAFFEIIGTRTWDLDIVRNFASTCSRHSTLQSFFVGLYERSPKWGVSDWMNSPMELWKMLMRADFDGSDFSMNRRRELTEVYRNNIHQNFYDSLICESPRHYLSGHSRSSSQNGVLDLSAFCSAFFNRYRYVPKEQSRVKDDTSSPTNSIPNSPAPMRSTSFIKAKSKKELSVVGERGLDSLDSELVIVAEKTSESAPPSLIVRAGTQERLLDIIALGFTSDDFKKYDLNVDPSRADRLDTLFINTFLSTYRSICSPSTVLDGLKRRWQIPDRANEGSYSPKSPSGSEGAFDNRLRVLSILDVWIRDYFEDFMDDLDLMESLDKALDFLMTKESQSGFADLLKALREKVTKKSRSPLIAHEVKNVPTERFASAPLDVDQKSAESIIEGLDAQAVDLSRSVSLKDWIDVADMLENCVVSVSISPHTLQAQLRALAVMTDDSVIPLSDSFMCLSLLEIGAHSSSSFGDRHGKLASIGGNEPLSITNATAPFVTLLPSPVQRIFHFHNNVKAWTIYQVISASSARHRVARMKTLLDVARKSRKNSAAAGIIVRAIISGLLSPECRIFAKAWTTLQEVPLDGVDLRSAKDGNRPKSESAETYLELAEALYDEIVPVNSNTLVHALLAQSTTNTLKALSLVDAFDLFLDIHLRNPDQYFATTDPGSKSVKLVPKHADHAINHSSAIAKGISANMGLPLVNFEKRIAIYALAQQLTTPVSTPDISSSTLDFGFLVGSNTLDFAFDIDSAIFAANRDGERAVKVTKLKFFARLIEDEKEFRRKREKELKRLEIMFEKERQSRIKSAPAKSRDTSSGPMLSNLLRVNAMKRMKSSPNQSNSSLSTQGAETLSRPTPPSPLSNENPSAAVSSYFSKINDSSQIALSPKEDVKRTSPQSASGVKFAFDMRKNKPVKVVSLIHSRSHAASDFPKQDNVFRILTEDEQEILVQAVSRDEMFDWVRKLNEASIEVTKRLTDDSHSRDLSQNQITSDEVLLEDPDKPKQERAKRRIFARTKNPDEKRKKDKEQFPKVEDKRVFGEDLVTLLFREMREREEYPRRAKVDSNTSLSSSLLFWKRRPDKSPKEDDQSQVAASTLPEDIASVIWNEYNSLPIIVEKCLGEVEKRGLAEQGIYRLSGSSAAIKDLKALFNTGISDSHFINCLLNSVDAMAIDLSASEFGDINVITGVLKLFLREMPEPLCTFDLFDNFMQAAEIVEYDERMIAIKDLVHHLPAPNYFLLKRIIEHLERVTDFEETNHMYASNLAIVFGPTLLKPPPLAWYARRRIIQLGQMQDKVDSTDALAERLAKTSVTDLHSSDGLNTTDESSAYDTISSQEIAMTMKHLGKCNTIVKNMILQYHWLFDVANDMENSEQAVMEEQVYELGNDHYVEEIVDEPLPNPEYGL